MKLTVKFLGEHVIVCQDPYEGRLVYVALERGNRETASTAEVGGRRFGSLVYIIASALLTYHIPYLFLPLCGFK